MTKVVLSSLNEVGYIIIGSILWGFGIKSVYKTVC